MSVIAVLGIKLRPERTQEAPAILEQVLKVTRAFEGCESVEVFIQADDPTRMIALERWASEEADAKYRAFRAAETSSPLAELVAEAPTLTYYRQ